MCDIGNGQNESEEMEMDKKKYRIYLGLFSPEGVNRSVFGRHIHRVTRDERRWNELN